MSKGIKALIAFGVAFVVIACMVAGVLNTRMDLIKASEGINATYVNNQNVYDNMWKSFKEMTQVTDLQAEQFKDVYTALISGRYAADGEQKNLMFKMIQEQNPQLGTEIYLQLSDKIASGRAEFAQNQKLITDKIQVYNVLVQKHFIVAPLLGFDVKDAKDFIITSERTEKAFDSGKDEVINIKGE